MVLAANGARLKVIGAVGASEGRFRGPSDLAEAVLGPELMSLSIYDHPQELRRFLEQVTQAFIRILRGQAECIPPVEGGAVNPGEGDT